MNHDEILSMFEMIKNRFDAWDEVIAALNDKVSLLQTQVVGLTEEADVNEEKPGILAKELSAEDTDVDTLIVDPPSDSHIAKIKEIAHSSLTMAEAIQSLRDQKIGHSYNHARMLINKHRGVDNE